MTFGQDDYYDGKSGVKMEETGGTDDHLGEESRLITSLKLAGCVKRLSLNGS